MTLLPDPSTQILTTKMDTMLYTSSKRNRNATDSSTPSKMCGDDLFTINNKYTQLRVGYKKRRLLWRGLYIEGGYGFENKNIAEFQIHRSRQDTKMSTNAALQTWASTLNLNSKVSDYIHL